MKQVQAVGTASELQLADVYLGEVVLQNRKDLEPIPTGANIVWSVTPEIGWRLVSEHELRFRLHAKLAFEEGSPEPFALELSIIGVYRSNGSIAPEQVDAYTRTHALPLLWPYLREAVSDLTRRMGGPVIYLTTVNVRFDEAIRATTLRTKKVPAALNSPAVDKEGSTNNAGEVGAKPRRRRMAAKA